MIPIVGSSARRFYHGLRDRLFGRPRFYGSETYWERRYATGGNSGSGSYGRLSEYKAEFLNSFVEEHQIHSLIDSAVATGISYNWLAIPHTPDST